MSVTTSEGVRERLPLRSGSLAPRSATLPQNAGLVAISGDGNTRSSGHDLNDVVGTAVREATALLEDDGFTVIPAIDVDKRVALTADLLPTRCRLFQRDGIVIRALAG